MGTGLLRFETLMKKVKEQKPYIAMLLENSNPQRYHGDVEYLQGVYDRV